MSQNLSTTRMRSKRANVTQRRVAELSGRDAADAAGEEGDAKAAVFRLLNRSTMLIFQPIPG